MNRALVSTAALLAVVVVIGVEGNLFVTTSAPYQLRPGITCTKESETSDFFSVVLNVFENDYNFTDDNGMDLHYTCKAINVSMLVPDEMIQFADEMTCYNETNMFMTIQNASLLAADEIDNVQQRTHYLKQMNFTMMDVPCGGSSDADYFYFAAFCYLEAGFNHQQDRIVYFSVNKSDCIPEQQDTDAIEVENPSETQLTRRYDVGCKLYNTNTRNLTDLNMNFEMSDPANEVTAPVNLGDPLYVECCIAIGETDPRKYFIDGVSVLGLNLRNCMARIDPLKAAEYLGTINPVEVVDMEGCGTGKSPMAAWATDSYQFKFGLGDDTETTMLWLKSPNCFRSDVFEAVSFARKDVSSTSEVILECDVAYCTNSTDEDCFGVVTNFPGEEMNYAGECPPVVTRRRRNAEEDAIPDNLPKTATFGYTVVENIIVTEAPSSGNAGGSGGCLSKPTFIGLSAALAAILALVLCIDACLAIKLMSRSSKRSDSSRSSDSGSRSVSSGHGFSNKGFYN